MKTNISWIFAAAAAVLFTFQVVDLSVADEKKKTKEGGVMKILIPDMSCEGCSSTVTKALKKLDGVSKAEVNLKHKVALIDTKETIDVNTLTQAVEKAGYKVQKIQRSELSFKKAKEQMEKKSAS